MNEETGALCPRCDRCLGGAGPCRRPTDLCSVGCASWRTASTTALRLGSDGLGRRFGGLRSLGTAGCPCVGIDGMRTLGEASEASDTGCRQRRGAWLCVASSQVQTGAVCPCLLRGPLPLQRLEPPLQRHRAGPQETSLESFRSRAMQPLVPKGFIKMHKGRATTSLLQIALKGGDLDSFGLFSLNFSLNRNCFEVSVEAPALAGPCPCGEHRGLRCCGEAFDAAELLRRARRGALRSDALQMRRHRRPPRRSV